MACIDATRPAAVEEVRIPLEQLDDATLRAMCDGGWLDHREYIAIARARGVLVAEGASLPAVSTGPEGAFVIMLPCGIGAPELLAALRPIGGRVLAALDCPAPGALTLPAADTRMQHQRPRETPIISIA